MIYHSSIIAFFLLMACLLQAKETQSWIHRPTPLSPLEKELGTLYEMGEDLPILEGEELSLQKAKMEKKLKFIKDEFSPHFGREMIEALDSNERNVLFKSLWFGVYERIDLRSPDVLKYCRQKLELVNWDNGENLGIILDNCMRVLLREGNKEDREFLRLLFKKMDYIESQSFSHIKRKLDLLEKRDQNHAHLSGSRMQQNVFTEDVENQPEIQKKVFDRGVWFYVGAGFLLTLLGLWFIQSRFKLVDSR